MRRRSSRSRSVLATRCPPPATRRSLPVSLRAAATARRRVLRAAAVLGLAVAARRTMSTSWEGMWSRGLARGQAFDADRVEPALVALMERRALPTGRALVPGCGRGYSLVQLATAERSALGLDINAATVEHINFMMIGAMIIFFLIVEPHGLARLWQIAKEKLRTWPFPYS